MRAIDLVSGENDPDSPPPVADADESLLLETTRAAEGEGEVKAEEDAPGGESKDAETARLTPGAKQRTRILTDAELEKRCEVLKVSRCTDEGFIKQSMSMNQFL